MCLRVKAPAPAEAIYQAAFPITAAAAPVVVAAVPGVRSTTFNCPLLVVSAQVMLSTVATVAVAVAPAGVYSSISSRYTLML